MNAEALYFREQAAGVRLLAREVFNDGAHAALADLAHEYDALSLDPKPWPPLAAAPHSHAAGRSTEPTDTKPFLERRRPGRVEYSNKALIELMRAPPEHAPRVISINDTSAAASGLSSAKGALMGVAISTGMWIAGLFLLHSIL